MRCYVDVRAQATEQHAASGSSHENAGHVCIHEHGFRFAQLAVHQPIIVLLLCVNAGLLRDKTCSSRMRATHCATMINDLE